MTTEPVKDLATDYDIFDPEYIKNPFPAWAELREKCPIPCINEYAFSNDRSNYFASYRGNSGSFMNYPG